MATAWLDSFQGLLDWYVAYAGAGVDEGEAGAGTDDVATIVDAVGMVSRERHDPGYLRALPDGGHAAGVADDLPLVVQLGCCEVVDGEAGGCERHLVGGSGQRHQRAGQDSKQ